MGNYSHYTWWSVSIFLYWIFLRILNYSSYIATTVISIQFLVMSVCLFMSSNECTMLQNAYNEMGKVKYFWGNGSVHYFPIVIVIAFQLSWDRPTFYRQVYLAYALVMAYIGTGYFHVYGCNVTQWQLYVAATVFHLLVAGLGRLMGWDKN